MIAFITGIDGSLGSELKRELTFASVSKSYNVIGTTRGLNRRYAVERHCAAAIAQVDDAHVDVLILNDGVNRLSFIGEAGDDTEDALIMEVNVMAMFWTLNYILKKQAKPPSKIIFIASQTHRVAQRGTALYCASKAAVVQMSRVVARELGAKGSQVNVLCPGKIEDTAMSEMTDAQVREIRGWSQAEADSYAKSLIPMGRFTSRAEVAAAVRWLLAAPSYVHGSVIDMTGGV